MGMIKATRQIQAQFELPPETLDMWREALALDRPMEDVKEGEVIDILTFDLGRDIKIDLKLCNSSGEERHRNGPWCDAILFRDGVEIDRIEPSFEPLDTGSFNFSTSIDWGDGVKRSLFVRLTIRALSSDSSMTPAGGARGVPL